MRLREIFSIYKRKLPSGKVVFYYQCYDEDGRRLSGHSTGMCTKTAARDFCIALFRSGKLLPKDQKRIPTFAEFAKGWWEWETCSYVLRQKKYKKISKGYVAGSRGRMKNHLIPRFGKMRLDKIDESNIEDMLVALTTEPPKELTNQPTDSATNADIEKREAEAIKRHRKRVKVKVKKAMSNSSANRVLDVLSVMLGEAYRRKIIKGNPCKLVRQFSETKKTRKILSLSEVHSLFSGEWSEKWDDEMFCVMNKLAACTGMRLGEIVGLRGEFVFEKYINVCGQHTRFGYGDTKTHKERVVPLPAIMRLDLIPLLKLNGTGYVFSKDKGETPVCRHGLTNALADALTLINIDKAEQVKRGLTFHAWRHFFNTTLRMANVSDSKVNSVTGHLTDDMNDWYTQYNNLELQEVYSVQENILVAKPQIENHSV